MQHSRINKSTYGFTLVEAITVVAILGIISAIAWPQFEKQLLKQRRAEAVGAITRIAADMQKHFSDNTDYTTYVISPKISGTLTRYTASVSTPSASTYIITLTATGAQTADADCATFTLNQLGQRGYTGSAPSAVRCWGSN